jgi:hypothetical protein
MTGRGCEPSPLSIAKESENQGDVSTRLMGTWSLRSVVKMVSTRLSATMCDIMELILRQSQPVSASDVVLQH